MDGHLLKSDDIKWSKNAEKRLFKSLNVRKVIIKK